jgi:general secretion pathway protein H
VLAHAVTMRKFGRASGFTLIEILVVVGIVAVIMTVAVLKLSLVGDDRELRREARRFMSLVELAQDDALLQGREFGLELMSDSYRFVEYDPIANQWSEIFGDDHLRLRQLPEKMAFELFLEDRQILLDIEAEDMEQNDDRANFRSIDHYAPHILIFSSGDRTPFELRFVWQVDDQSVVLQSDLLGKIDFLVDEN